MSSTGGLRIPWTTPEPQNNAFDVSANQLQSPDNQIEITGNTNWGGFKLTSLGDPTNPQDAVTKNFSDTTYEPILGFTPENLANKNQPSGYPGLNASSKILGSQIIYGTGSNTATEGNDVRLSDARTPLAHQSTHQSGNSDALTGLLDAIAKTTVRKNTGADVGSRRRLNFIEGANITLTVTDDVPGEEVDVTIAGSVITSPLTTKGDLFGFDTADNRIAVGTNGQILTANSAFALGVEWANAPASGITTINGDGTAAQVLIGGTNIAIVDVGANHTFNWSAASTDLTDSANLARNTNNLSFFAATTSAQLAGVISDETGSGALVFATSPVLVTPNIGTPSAGTLDMTNITLDGTKAEFNTALSDDNFAYLGTAQTFSATNTFKRIEFNALDFGANSDNWISSAGVVGLRINGGGLAGAVTIAGDGADLAIFDGSSIIFESDLLMNNGKKISTFGANDVILNALSGQTISLEVNGVEEYSFSNTEADYKTNNIINLGLLNTHTIPGGTDTFAMLGVANIFTEPQDITKTLQIGNSGVVGDFESFTVHHTSNSGSGFFIQLDGNDPFVAFTGFDTGSVRINAYGGGGFNVDAANSHRFFTDPDYSTTPNQGVSRLQINQNGDLGIASGLSIYFDGVGATGDTSIRQSVGNTLALETGGIDWLFSATAFTVPTTANIVLNEGDITLTEGDIILNESNLVLDTTIGTKIGTSTTQKLGFYNVSPVIQQSALTVTDTSITHTAPGTPDFAIQDLVNPGFGFVTKDEGNTVLQVILNLQIRVNELESRLQTYGYLP